MGFLSRRALSLCLGNALPCLPLPTLLVPSVPAFSALGQEQIRSFCQRRQQLNRNYMTLKTARLNFSSSSTGWPWIAPCSFPVHNDGTRLQMGTSEMFSQVRALFHQALHFGFDPWSTHSCRRKLTPSDPYIQAMAHVCTHTTSKCKEREGKGGERGH